MKLIVGLGNPGPRYRNTRHNVGFRVLDLLAERYRVALDREKYRGLIGEARLAGEKVLLLKPLTYMNRSGESVAQAMRYNSATPADVLVVVDDVNLPVGKLRMRGNGSAGGHNGLKSIIDHLGGVDFARLRVGVGSSAPGSDLVNHVLGTFHADERDEVEQAVERAADAVEAWLKAGLQEAMNNFN